MSKRPAHGVVTDDTGASLVLDRPMSTREVDTARGAGLPRALIRAINAKLIAGPYEERHRMLELHISVTELSRVPEPQREHY